MRCRLPFAIVALAAAAAACASPLDEAIGLYKEKKYPEARAAFEKILAAEPTNAAACFYLGTTLLRRGDKEAVEDALPWLEKATHLDPANATYLADYGGVAMLVADKRQSPFTSIGLAKKGRDAMEKSLTMDPENMEARVGLWRFYSSAPRALGLGDDAKATAQLEEIRQRDPKRASMLLLDAQLRAKNFTQAFRLCDELLAKTPEDFFALFQYARVSIASGQNLERGLSCLKKYVSLGTSSSPGTANLGLAWLRLGTIEEKLGRPNEARTAYQKALQLVPNDPGAASALANLK